MLRARYARAARATRVEGLKNSQKQSKSVKISQKQAVTHSKFENFENLTPFSGLFCHSKMVFMSKVVGPHLGATFTRNVPNDISPGFKASSFFQYAYYDPLKLFLTFYRIKVKRLEVISM